MDDDTLIDDDVEHRDQPMARLTDPAAPASSASGGGVSSLSSVPVSDDRSAANSVRDSLSGKQVCPFCGSQNAPSANSATNSQGPCPRCTMEDTAATRQATKARIGPWHVLQTRNPAAPGMRYATLLALVSKGQVTARSVVRGPTTHQLWRYAAHVKGLSREFGVCYSCGEALDKTAANCPHCDRAQDPAGNPDALLETRESAAPVVASVPKLVVDEPVPADSYPLATRQSMSATPILSHAERLRTANERAAADARRRPDGRAFSAMELAAALQVSPTAAPTQKSHPVRTLVITLIIVSILGSVIVGFARPDLRQQATNWTQTRWNSVSDAVANFHLQKPPPSDGAVPSTDTPAAPDNATAQAPPAGPAPQPADTFPGQSTVEVSGASAGQQNAAPAPIVSIAPSNATTPSAPPATPAPAVAPQATPAAAPDQPVINSPGPEARAALLPDRPVLISGSPSSSEIWQLHSRGLEAEGRQDWAEALRCYQQIELAPKDLWPGDVKIRLANAQRQLNR
jgi:hypothetical protein